MRGEEVHRISLAEELETERRVPSLAEVAAYSERGRHRRERMMGIRPELRCRECLGRGHVGCGRVCPVCFGMGGYRDGDGEVLWVGAGI